MPADRVRAYVSVGSNVARERNVRSAIAALRERFGPLEASPVYETEPVGMAGEPFFNLVVGFETEAGVRELVETLRAIEAAHGRERGGSRFVSRSLDLDLLLFGEAVIDEPGLELPRPDIERYAFVLRPLAELAGERRHPRTGEPLARMWARLRRRLEGEGLWPAALDAATL